MAAKLKTVRLTADYVVCIDGIHPTRFLASELAHLPEDIADALLADGRAVEAKMSGEAEENKMLGGAPEDKAARKKRQGR